MIDPRTLPTEEPAPAGVAHLLRRAFGSFPSGVAALAALVDGRPAGLAASSFTSVSLDPPLVSICIAHSSSTWPVLAQAPRLGVSVLAADQQRHGRQLAQRGVDRFAGISWHATEHGAVLLDGAAGWFETSVHQVVPAGDHDIVLLRVHGHHADHLATPLVFHASRFHRLEVAG